MSCNRESQRTHAADAIFRCLYVAICSAVRTFSIFLRQAIVSSCDFLLSSANFADCFWGGSLSSSLAASFCSSCRGNYEFAGNRQQFLILLRTNVKLSPNARRTQVAVGPTRKRNEAGRSAKEQRGDNLGRSIVLCGSICTPILLWRHRGRVYRRPASPPRRPAARTISRPQAPPARRRRPWPKKSKTAAPGLPTVDSSTT